MTREFLSQIIVKRKTFLDGLDKMIENIIKVASARLKVEMYYTNAYVIIDALIGIDEDLAGGYRNSKKELQEEKACLIGLRDQITNLRSYAKHSDVTDPAFFRLVNALNAKFSELLKINSKVNNVLRIR
ncbi:hypothetical protein HYX18_01830 [Candidatus Woesearchaeota archaeon]|nr:hypothetical protein [Candidatus Woesearchaeota archaeon]